MIVWCVSRVCFTIIITIGLSYLILVIISIQSTLKLTVQVIERLIVKLTPESRGGLQSDGHETHDTIYCIIKY